MESARQGSISVMAARALGPVSGHPLFPVIVSLWFAALFGLGGLAVQPLPSALMLALVGGLIGALLGRMIAAGRATVRNGSRSRQTYQPIFAPEVPVEEEAEPACRDEPQEEACPATDIASPEPIPVQEEEVPGAPEPVTESTVVQLPPLGKAAQRLLAADLDALSPLHLVERLGISLERRRALMSRVPARPASPAASLRRVHSAPAVRIGNARVDNARVENERALRSALATLQSVKGAA